ncbi:S8 family peptidase [Paenibacillus glufosinatiresistens]|uniref:S8 family peptidase n=1 Tax=Paenibacillus glufosinatiresistens TaxID=3070657 RepID=UPI00286D6A3A|nr:S8 family serine peptidase [Paenibacillus sp. YX.27]
MPRLFKILLLIVTFTVITITIKSADSQKKSSSIRKLTGRNVKVAIIDSGLNLGSPLLFSNVVATRNFIDDSESVLDDVGHGTQIASIIAAKPNTIGSFSGIAPEADLLIAKVLSHENNNIDYVTEALYWAVNNGAKLINISLYYRKYNSELKKAVDYAVKNNVIVISSAGNFGKNNIGYPARFTETLSVFATNSHGNLVDFSSYSPKSDVGAIGLNVKVASYTNSKWNLLFENGTSYSAAIVTGYLSLLWQYYPECSAQSILELFYNHLTYSNKDNNYYFWLNFKGSSFLTDLLGSELSS